LRVVSGARCHASLNFGHHRCRKRGQHAEVALGPFARSVIVGAQGAKHIPLVGRERYAGVGSAPWLAGSKRGVSSDIGDEDGKSRGNHILTEREVERMPPYGRRPLNACHTLDVLAVDVDERDHDRGNAQELSGETREGIQPVFRRCIEESCIVERGEPDGARQCLLIGQEGNKEKRIPTL